jgi:hypothetical protein
MSSRLLLSETLTAALLLDIRGEQKVDPRFLMACIGQSVYSASVSLATTWNCWLAGAFDELMQSMLVYMFACW